MRGALRPSGRVLPGGASPCSALGDAAAPMGAGGDGEAGCGGRVPVGVWESTRCKSVPGAWKISAVNNVNF